LSHISHSLLINNTVKIKAISAQMKSIGLSATVTRGRKQKQYMSELTSWTLGKLQTISVVKFCQSDK